MSMRIEREKIQLRTLNIKQIEKSKRIVGPSGEPGFNVTSGQMEMLAHLMSGASIYDLVTHYFNLQVIISFRQLRDMIAFLVHDGLILNPSFRAYFSSREERPKSAIRNWIGRVLKPGKTTELNQEMQKFSFFRSLPSEIRDAFCEVGQSAWIPEDTHLFEAGKERRVLFALVEGQASILKPVKDSRPVKVGSLDAGSLFGETGFFLNQPAQADVVTDKESLILYFKYVPQKFDRWTVGGGAQYFRERMAAIEALSRSKLFGGLPSDCFDSLLLGGNQVHFAANRFVFKEGESGNTCYIIIKGRVDVVRGNRSMGGLGEGDCFGEMALITTGGVRSASIHCDTEVVALEIPDHRFYDLLAENLFLACRFEKVANRRARQEKKFAPAA